MKRSVLINASGRYWYYSLRNLFKYRKLALLLAKRDVLIKFANTTLGVLWAILNPLLLTILLLLVFTSIRGEGFSDANYPLFILLGVLVWNYFSACFSEGGNSILETEAVIKKVYFPKALLPISKCLSALVEMVVILLMITVYTVYKGSALSANLVYFPIFLFFTILFSFSTAILMSALIARFRDIRHILPFVLRIGFFATPVAYDVSDLADKFQNLIILNPLTFCIEGLRWSVIGGTMSSSIFISGSLIISFSIISLIVFWMVEKNLVDRI